jgi:peptidoglycan/LPS O-acetylase OafA/YrhL
VVKLDTSSDSTSVPTFTQLERRYDIDWLRIIAILLVFIYHGTRFFDAEDWHLRNAETNPMITGYMSFLTAIGMPLFFTIAGLGTFYALGFLEAREIKGRKYVFLRFVRLMIPFAVGLFTHITLQVYLERVSTGVFTGSFFEFYPNYFNGLYGFNGGNFAFYGHHLWFLVLLFIFTLLTYNLFKFMRKEKRHKSMARFAKFFSKPGMIYLFPLPLFIIEFFYSMFLTDIPRFGGWNIISLLILYIYGFILAYDKQFKETIKKHAKVSLIIGILSTIALGILINFTFEELFITPPEGFSYIVLLYWFFRSIFAWSWLIVILYAGEKYLNKESKARKFLNELVLPFYILHQTLLIVIGYFIIEFNIAIFWKYLIIISLSLVGILLLLLIIREVNSLRFLFGMRVKKEKGVFRFLRKKKVVE